MTNSLYYLPFNLIWGDGLNKAEKSQVRIDIINMQENHCEGCTKYPETFAYSSSLVQWCQSNCEIGQRLKS